MLIRTSEWWTDVVLKKGDHVIIHLDENDIEDGYMIYSIMEKELIVHEIIVLDEIIKKEFWNFVCQHDSMVISVKWKTYDTDRLLYMLQNPRVQIDINPYFMGRIVNVERFLRKYPFLLDRNNRLVLHIKDDTCKWNNGIYIMEDGTIKISEQENHDGDTQKKGLYLDIGTLTSVLLGHCDAEYLFEIGEIKGDREQVRLLQSIQPRTGSLLFDFF